MQTFLPYPNFRESAQALDNKRLGKQRVEAFQILKTLNSGRKAWANHPATRMWRGYEHALTIYMDSMIVEWVRRGFKNTMEVVGYPFVRLFPPWFGNPDFHSSHRAALLAKAPEHYSQFGWTETPQINYIWPV